MKYSPSTFEIFTIAVICTVVCCAPNPWTTTTAGVTQCSAYCMYTIRTNNNLLAQCTATSTTNGFCNLCDPLLFAPVSNGYCIPHLFNSQSDFRYYSYYAVTDSPTLGSRRLGYYTATSRNTDTVTSNIMVQVTSSLPAHFAVRIRFGVYFQDNSNTRYKYPLQYAMDTMNYIYDQSKLNYFSFNDIITSPLQTHYANNLTVTWRNNDTGIPDNNGGCGNGDCQCSGGCGCGCSVQNCCDNRYIEILDMIVFLSLCPSNCASCVSATTCKSCNTGYTLNYADQLCYSACPQQTYSNSTMYVVGNKASFASYVAQAMTYCVPCSNVSVYCMTCTNSTTCTRCFTIGKNQSYLFNNTCVPNPCPNGFIANMTNHTCDCPVQYHFSNITANNAFMWCYTCAFQCVQCFGLTNLACTVCQVGFYLANATTFCLNQCPDGQFLNPSTQTCYLCDISCSTCINTSTTCTQCFTNAVRYLLGTVCLSWCPNGYSWNNITRTCDLCNFYTYSYLGACVTLCPSMYQANVANRSCLPYSQTNFQFTLVLQKVQVLSHGKLLRYTILVQDGLNTASLNWIKHKSYNYATVIYGSSQLNSFVGIRSLQTINLAIRNLNYANNRITYTTNLPDSLDYHRSFQISFPTTLYSQQGIKYSNFTNVYNINQNPQLMSQYYTYSAQNRYNLLMIPFLAIILLIFQLQIKGTYQMYIEAFRIVQILGLLIYSAHPIGAYTFYFLVGCSYCNFDFVPNLYAMIVQPSQQNNFASYFLSTPDMDFIRLMGSIIFLGAIVLFLYMVFRFLLKTKQPHLDFLLKFGIDLMEVKIFHSFWSSFLYIVANYSSVQFGMYIIFVFALLFLAGILGRRYSLWKQTSDLSPFFIWRAMSTLLVCFIAMANQIVISILVLVSLCITLWHFFMLHSNKYLVNINDLNSSNYMEERTYKVLNNFDIEVSYSFSIPARNTIITLCPIFTALLSGVLILLKDVEYYSIVFTIVLVYTLQLLVIIVTVIIYKFLHERRRFLVQNKIQYLQKKYSKLRTNDTQISEERRRPRIQTHYINFDEDRHFEGGIQNREMMKTFD